MRSNKTVNAWRIALVLVGTVIGAGFASGAEIMAYFTCFGKAGFYGMIVAGIIFLAGVYGTLRIAYEHKSTDYGEFAEIVAGRWFGPILDAIVTLSMLLGYGVMLAGSGAIFLQLWGLPAWMGVMAMAAGSYFALAGDENRLIRINQLVTPVLVSGILLLGLYAAGGALEKQDVARLFVQPISAVSLQPVNNVLPALVSAVLYAAYNMLGAAAVLVGVSTKISGRVEAAKAAFLGSLILLILTLVLGVATFLNYDTIREISIPALALLNRLKLGQQLYAVVLLGAMYTTAVADGFGFLNRAKTLFPFKRKAMVLLMMAISLLMAKFGFGDLVEKGYRLFGYLGIVQLLLIMVQCISKKENINEKQRRREGNPQK